MCRLAGKDPQKILKDWWMTPHSQKEALAITNKPKRGEKANLK